MGSAGAEHQGDLRTASSQGDADDVRMVSSLHLALACTAVVYAVHKTKKIKTEAAKLRETLWGMEFRPLSASRRLLLAVIGPLGIVALVLHAGDMLGPGAAVLVVGLVCIVLRNAGVFRSLWTNASKLGAKRGSLPEGAALPVWVVTGFLGSGKTTLVNRLVRQEPRLLVVENEAGEVALDAELVIQAAGQKENVLLLNDGCACCKVRGDLCDLLRDEVLGTRLPRGGVGGLVIECSGLADPKAVVQTFLLDTDLRSKLELREVVAVVDTMHVGRYLAETSPLARLVEEQIAFASLVLLNKVGCAGNLRPIIDGIQRVNRTAEVLECDYCEVDTARVLGGAGFQPPPGAWSPARALLDVEAVHIDVGAAPAPPEGEPKPGVRCVSLRVDGELNLDAFNRWVLTTLSDMEVLRAKGVLAAAGHQEKLAFQAVHAVFDGTPSLTARWKPGEPRFSQIVFIGCELREDLIAFGLKRCRA